MAALSHNKRMNVGLVYEMLIRELSSALIDSNERTVSLVTSILERHFSEGSILLSELDIHRTVVERRGVPVGLARRIVDEIKLAGAKLNKPMISGAKHKLIREIDASLGTEIFSRHKIAEYKAHASVNLLIQKGFDRRIDEGIEMVGIEEYLIAFLSSDKIQEQFSDAPAKLAYGIALEAYENEYGKSLDQHQKELLAEHVRVKLGAKPAGTVKMLEKHRNLILTSINKGMFLNETKEDPEIRKRLVETKNSLINLSIKADVDTIEQMMLFHDLRREIES